MPQDHLSQLSFKELALPDALQQGIADAGFTHCTPIQARTLPIALEGRDVAGQAQTGTGKTAAFLLALYNTLQHREPLTGGLQGPRALVLRVFEVARVLLRAGRELGSERG